MSAPWRRRLRLSRSSSAHSSRRAAVRASRSMRFTVRMPDAAAPAAFDQRGGIPTAVLEVRSEEILTGEAVALDVQPVGFFLRALGCLIDVLIAIVLFILFLLASSWLVGANVLDST